MKSHVEIGVGMAKVMIDDLGLTNDIASKIILDVIATHHERGDGSGYPKGLMLEKILLAGKIVAIADTYDALTQCRPYKTASSDVQALDELR